MKLDLTTGSIDKLIFKIAIPVALGYMFHNLLNITDTYFAGHISTNAVAALAKSFPVFFLIIAFSSGFSSALTGLISNAIGAKDFDEARKTFYQGLSFSIILSVIITVVGYAFSPYILSKLAPSPETFTMAVSFNRVIFLGTIFFVLNNFLNSALMAQGDSRTFGIVLLVECILNVVLDYIFIHGCLGFPKMGVEGLGLATILVQIFGAFYLAFAVLRSGFVTDYKMSKMKPDFAYFGMIVKYGIPSVSNMVLIGVGSFIILNYLVPFGDLVSAGYGIGLRVEQIFLLPAIGLSIATLSIVGQNYGANNWERIILVYKKCIIYASIFCVVGGGITYMLKGWIIPQFSNDPVLFKAASEYLICAVFVSISYCILHITNSALLGMRRPNFALFIGLFRQVVGLVIICEIALAVKYSETSVFLGILIVNWLAAFIALGYFSRQKPDAVKVVEPVVSAS